MDFSKADFYLGLHDNAWYFGTTYKLGSPTTLPLDILTAKTKVDFANAVMDLISAHGYEKWPHIWPDSRGTDYSYFFDEETMKVWCSSMGDELFDPIAFRSGDRYEDTMKGEYPRFPMIIKHGS